jgi:hypothetical protein
MVEANTFGIFIKVSSVFTSERLSANIKLALHKALTKCVMTSTCPWWYAADMLLPKLQYVQNNFLRTVGEFPKYTPIHY